MESKNAGAQGLIKVNTVITDADIRNAGYITNELKPCPFCGCKKIMTAATKNERTENIVYKAWCSGDIIGCGASITVCIGKEDTIKESREELVKNWNTRAQEKESTKNSGLAICGVVQQRELLFAYEKEMHELENDVSIYMRVDSYLTHYSKL